VYFFRQRRPILSTTLRLRLIVSITVVLLMILLPGSLLVYWHAVHKVDVELRAAAAVGANTVHNAVDDAEEAASPLRHLQLLIADFNGDRHLRATLLDPAGRVLFQSAPLKPSEPAPNWFYRLLARRPMIIPILLPSPFDRIGRIVLQADAHNEISEVWDDTVLTLLILGLFCGMNAALVYWITWRALRPLETVSAAFTRLGAGDYSLRVAELGPRELAQVSHGLNQLAGQLPEAETRRLKLEQQLAAVQEEERADLARDLHDEIGPLLFAVGIDLAVIQRDPSILDTGVAARVGAVRESIARIYDDIKRILGRLRTVTPTELGLAQAIGNLISFWGLRYPKLEFRCDIPEEGFGELIDDAVYHIVKESLSNALRHGKPSRLTIAAAILDGAVVATVRDDGGGFSPSIGPGSGFGLASMEQRVNALGGSLRVTATDEGPRGVTVSARIPIATAEEEPSGAAIVRVASS
jgi:two-component system, NarL family, sensor histidine kinase UhpB